jgi:hypothetical protein
VTGKCACCEAKDVEVFWWPHTQKYFCSICRNFAINQRDEDNKDKRLNDEKAS